MAEHERTFKLFGSEVRILVGPAEDPGQLSPEVAASLVEGFMRSFERRLTRFDPTSELSLLNADPRREVPVSQLLADALRTALQAADWSGGLVDPVILDAIENAGYRKSRAGRRPGPLQEALAWAPGRAPARPAAKEEWRLIAVSTDPPLVRRPPGVQVELGGTGKGLAADLAAGPLAGYSSFVIDAGGDLRIGGKQARDRVVEVSDPFGPGSIYSFELRRGAVATSGLKTRVWRHGDGFSHHLIDPASGRPAWTGVVQATALAGSAVLAETLAKAALLSGPERGLELLGEYGGALVLDSGEIALAGPIATAGCKHVPVAA